MLRTILSFPLKGDGSIRGGKEQSGEGEARTKRTPKEAQGDRISRPFETSFRRDERCPGKRIHDSSRDYSLIAIFSANRNSKADR